MPARTSAANSMVIGAPTEFKRGVVGTVMPGETDNLTDLENLTEETLLLELNLRYNRDCIYTYVGDILCAINPFKTIDGLYSMAAMKDYTGLSGLADKPPHLFALADSAFSNMVAGSGGTGNQVCVISGESGAGKTESAKLFMKQIINLSNKGGGGGDELAGLEDKIVNLNPLLEAFGNAQTLMNDNSSRFGKFIELRFDQQQTITGAIIREYLLEKSRVMTQVDGEQNFHVFYLFFAGSSNSKEKYAVDDPMEHRIINNNEEAIENIELPKTKGMWDELVQCFSEVGFGESETETIFHMLAGILHLGDVEMGGGDDDAYVVSAEDVLRKVADQFSVDITAFQEALITITITTRGESVTRHYNQTDAEDARDALSKAVYDRLFSWLVRQCNKLVGPKTKSMMYSTISILDIFGFEVFNHNSFEQLLINLANEQLQWFFNNHIFAMELAEYEKEGIEASAINFSDNKDLLDMFLGKPIGLLALCDEEARMPQGSDRTFLEKVNSHLSKRSGISFPRGDSGEFTISHYAGDVTYEVEAFLDKNRDTLAADLIAVMRLSEQPLIEELFGGNDKSNKGAKGRGKGGRGGMADKKAMRASVKKVKREQEKVNKLTVGAGFKNSLAELMLEMSRAQPHFVRCIKPNLDKAAKSFKIELVTKQLRYTGMLETTRIRKEGYSHRPTFADFINRYKAIGFPLNAKPSATAMNCEAICARANITGWQVGKTKVFLRYFHMGELGQALRPYPTAAAQVQTAARCYVARKQFEALAAAKKQQTSEMNAFFVKMQRQINAKFEEVKVLTEEDAMRPPDFFDRKKKAAKSIKNGTMKKMQQKANKKGMTRAQSVKWFKEVEMKKGAGVSEEKDGFEMWFHGIITRKEAEVLLESMSPGAFLVRVSESRFGYSLSHKVFDDGRMKHYMIDVLPDGRYQVVGNKKLFDSLNDLVRFHRQHKIVASDPVALLEPCGQAAGQDDLAAIKS